MSRSQSDMPYEGRLEAVLSRIDRRKERFSESDIFAALNESAQHLRDAREDCRQSLEAEILAFHLVENCMADDDLWGTYYGPQAIGQNQKGERVDLPSLHSVTPEVVRYWGQRAEEAQHPIPRARYADLVWDFSKKVCGQGASVDMARITIDSNIAMVEQRLHRIQAVVPIKLRRALQLAFSISDRGRIENVTQCILAEHRDGYWHVWASIYDDLLWNRLSGITPTEGDRLIQGVEDELDAATKAEKPNASQIEDLSLWLASYYRRRNQLHDVRRVLGLFASTMLANDENGPAMTAVARCERAYEAYRQFNLSSEAELLLPQMAELSAKARDEMGRYSRSFEVPKEQLDAFLDEVTEGSLDTALRRIAVNLTEDEKEARRLLPQLAKSAPLTYLSAKHITNEDGVVIAKVGSLEDDEEGNIFQHMAMAMRLSTPILRMAIDAAVRKYSPTVEQILAFVYESPVYHPSRRAILEQGLTAYLNHDYISAVHLLIPQVEAAVRNLAGLLNLPLCRRGRRGGFQLRNLDELLQMEALERVLGRRQTLYLRVLLTDQRGWNLRNEVSHGIPRAEEFNAVVADRAFHALLVMAILRAGTEETEDKKPTRMVELE